MFVLGGSIINLTITSTVGFYIHVYIFNSYPYGGVESNSKQVKINKPYIRSSFVILWWFLIYFMFNKH